MLEDFLMEMTDKNAIEAAGQCLETAIEKNVVSFRKTRYSKPLLHTYLAWQAEPGLPFGQAITSHALKTDTKIANTFLCWIKELFSL